MIQVIPSQGASPESRDPYLVGMLRLGSLARASLSMTHGNHLVRVLRFLRVPPMRNERLQTIGLVVIALLILVVVLVRYGGMLPWSAR